MTLLSIPKGVIISGEPCIHFADIDEKGGSKTSKDFADVIYEWSLGQESILLLLPNDPATIGKHEVAVQLHVQDEPPIVAP